MRVRSRCFSISTWVDNSWRASLAPSKSHMSFPAFGLPRSWYNSGVQIVLSCTDVEGFGIRVGIDMKMPAAEVGPGHVVCDAAVHDRVDAVTQFISGDHIGGVCGGGEECACARGLSNWLICACRRLGPPKHHPDEVSSPGGGGRPWHEDPEIDSPGRTRRERASHPQETDSQRICWRCPPSSFPQTLQASLPEGSLIPWGDSKL